MLARAGRGHDTDPFRVGSEYAIEPTRLRQADAELRDHGLIADGRVLTPAGTEALARLRVAGREWLCSLVEGWEPERHADLAAMLDRVADEGVEGRAERGRHTPPTARRRHPPPLAALDIPVQTIRVGTHVCASGA